jgi:hypothetical protein
MQNFESAIIQPNVIMFNRANSHWSENGTVAYFSSLFVCLALQPNVIFFSDLKIKIPVWKIKLAMGNFSGQNSKKWKMCCIVLGDFFSRFCTGKIDTSQREMVVTNNLGMNAQHFCDHKTPWLMGFTTKTAKGLTLGWSQQYFSHILEVLGPREQGRSGLDCVKILIRRVQNNHRV